MKRIRQIILLFALISTQLISAQKTVIVDESIYLHANASTLVSRETLLYKVYCLKSSDKTPIFSIPVPSITYNFKYRIPHIQKNHEIYISN